jgi:tetratricopeptide (TPR) repeat protein
MKAAIESSKKSGQVAMDPLYSLFSKLGLGIAHFFDEHFQESEEALQSLLDFSDKNGTRQLSEIAISFLAPQLVAKGQMSEGLKMLEENQRSLLSNQRLSFYANSEMIMGAIYAQIATGPKPGLGVMARNFAFLAKNAPVAAKRAEDHFNKAIDICKKIGAKWYEGMAYFEFGRFYQARKKNDPARDCLSAAVRIFKECDACFNLKHAEEALLSLS